LNSEQLVGDMLVYMSGWSWAFFIVLSKRLMSKHSAVEISSGAIASCTVFLAPAVLCVYLSGADLSVDPQGWVAIVYLGILCTSAATLLWAMGLEGISATASATIMLIEVITALVLSIGFLDESLGLAAGIGAALVMASIYLVTATGGPTERSSVKQI
ncbi:MAG TPA: DMT family transporter, partial [Thermoplasmata archaeon]